VNVDYMGDVVIEISGGKYTDEATQKVTDLAAPLKAVLTTNGGTVDGIVTPVTTMAFTAAFPSASSAVTKAAFDTQVNSLASQFKLSAADLVTTPVVTGTTNAYGKVLAGLSTYLQYENKTLPQLVNSTFTTADWTAFSGLMPTPIKLPPGLTCSFPLLATRQPFQALVLGAEPAPAGLKWSAPSRLRRIHRSLESGLLRHWRGSRFLYGG
jgi:hypothetical protein